MSRLTRCLHSRVTHFALAGLLLFGARIWTESRGDAAQAIAPARRTPIVLSPEKARSLEAAFVERWGRPPDEAQRRALLAEAVQSEMLYREARLLSLDLEDGSVRRRLVEKMRVVNDRPGRSEDELVREAIALGLDDDVVIRRLLAEKMLLVLQQESGNEPLRDEELADYLERHRDEFIQPARVTLRQVFLSEQRRGAALASDAEETLLRLRATRAGAEQVAELSDPFPLDTRLSSYSQSQLQGRFGKSFAERVFTLEAGAWSEPIASPYGLHLVRVEEKQPADVPSLEEIRSTLSRAVLRERGQRDVARGLARLKELYRVRVDGEEVSGAGSVRRQTDS